MLRILSVNSEQIDEIPFDIVEFESAEVSAAVLANDVMVAIDLVSSRCETKYGHTNFCWENIVNITT